MPLLPDGSHICLVCENVRQLGTTDWILPESDTTVFVSPPCPGCGAQENFCYHDGVFLKEVRELRSVGKIDPDGPEQFVEMAWPEPDEEGYDARLMVSIEKVAKALGRKRKPLNPHPKEIKYANPPKAHTAAEMKAAVKERGKHLRETPKAKTKADAEKEYGEQVAAAARARSERASHVKAEKEHREKMKRPKALREVEEEGSLTEEALTLAEPVVDEPVQVVSDVKPKDASIVIDTMGESAHGADWNGH